MILLPKILNFYNPKCMSVISSGAQLKQQQSVPEMEQKLTVGFTE